MMESTMADDARCIRSTLIHEHAHYEVARHLGWHVRGVMVARNQVEGEHPWCGAMRSYSGEDARQRCVIGLAGLVGEAYAEHGDVFWLSNMLWFLTHARDQAALSIEDSEMAGDFDMSALEATIDAVRTVWLKIENGAKAHQMLIERGNIVFSVWMPDGEYRGFNAAEFAEFSREGEEPTA